MWLVVPDFALGQYGVESILVSVVVRISAPIDCVAVGGLFVALFVCTAFARVSSGHPACDASVARLLVEYELGSVSGGHVFFHLLPQCPGDLHLRGVQVRPQLPL